MTISRLDALETTNNDGLVVDEIAIVFQLTWGMYRGTFPKQGVVVKDANVVSSLRHDDSANCPNLGVT